MVVPLDTFSRVCSGVLCAFVRTSQKRKMKQWDLGWWSRDHNLRILGRSGESRLTRQPDQFSQSKCRNRIQRPTSHVPRLGASHARVRPCFSFYCVLHCRFVRVLAAPNVLESADLRRSCMVDRWDGPMCELCPIHPFRSVQEFNTAGCGQDGCEPCWLCYARDLNCFLLGFGYGRGRELGNVPGTDAGPLVRDTLPAPKKGGRT